MAARIVKIRHDDETRAKIQTSQLINRLTDHALGKVDMPATAVTAALGLIRKTLPDLASTEHSGQLSVGSMTDEELLGRLRELSLELGFGGIRGLPGGTEEAPDEDTVRH